MQRLKAFRLFFSLAALLFVAKPFFGFGAVSQQRQVQQHTIIAKSFTKRKPESLEDADANVEFIHRLLINPLTILLSSITFLLLNLFGGAFKNVLKITARLLSDIHNALFPRENARLLTGQLLI